MKEIKVESSDILALEGTVRGSKVRIIQVYMDSKKKKKERFRKKQEDSRTSRKTI